MENLVFALNSTMPVFLIMVVGYFFRRVGLMDEKFASSMNTFVFKILLPVKVFQDLATVDFREMWDFGFVLFCFIATLGSILIAIGLSFLFKDRSIRGEFVQASYRSSAVLLGIAFVNNIYGSSGMTPLMVIGSVPLYNIMAVIVLTMMNPESEGINQAVIKKTLIGIAKNPIIISIVIGLLWSLLGIPLDGIPKKAVSSLAATATPMGLLAMGALTDLKKTAGKLAPSVTAAFMKLMGFCIIWLPIAILLGFRTEKLVAVLIMLGSASTVSCFVMAKSMGHEGTVSSSTVMFTTLFSAISLTFWLWLVRSLELI